MDVQDLLEKMHVYEASDLYLTVGLPATWRGDKTVKDSTNLKLTQEHIYDILNQIAAPEDVEKFKKDKELNLAIQSRGGDRFRVNVFFQQNWPGIVIRKMQTKIPEIDNLSLDLTYKEAIMQNRGLILVVGTSGSGKSTSVAAMLHHRNLNGAGHVITVEDPIEYVHTHRNCIFTQREVGADTHSWSEALKNALRQRPDIVYIGEIRNAETMEHAIHFAETGHLCIATMHATSASQAIERIANFFPSNSRSQYLYSLGHVLKYVFAQRLVTAKTGKKTPALEILINSGFIKPLIIEGKIGEIKEIMNRNADYGMMTFEKSLINLLNKGTITEDVAVAESDHPDNMRLSIMQTKVRENSKKDSFTF